MGCIDVELKGDLLFWFFCAPTTGRSCKCDDGCSFLMSDDT